MRGTVGSWCLVGACVAQLSAQAPAPAAPKARTTPDVWHPQLEQFSPPGTLQTEFGSALSESGYRKLLAALTWTPPSERADYYFDAFDGREFLLRTGGMPLKVRIKVKKQGPQWQVSRFVAKDRVIVGALGVYVHITESWEGPLDGPRAAALLAASDAFAARLDLGGQPLREAADLVEAAYQELRRDTPLPGQMVIDRTLADRSYRFYPRKVTPAKTRLSATLPGLTAPVVTLTLGSEPEVDAEGHAIVAYELEAEADRPVTLEEAPVIAAAIGHLMQQAGLTALDQQEVRSLSNDFTLRQLLR